MTTLGEKKSTARPATTPWGVSCLAGALLSIAVAVVQAVRTVVPGEPAFTGVALAFGLGGLLLAAGPVGLQRSGALGGRATAATAAGVLGALGVLLGTVVSWAVGRDTEAFYIVGTVLLFAWAVAAAVLALRTRAWAWPWRGVPLLVAVVMVVTVPFFGLAGVLSSIMLAVMWVAYAVLGMALLRDRGAR